MIRSVLNEAGIGAEARIEALSYSDRYLRSPLVLRLCLDTLAALTPENTRTKVDIRTTNLPSNERSPSRLEHDWRRDDDRADVASILGHARGLSVSFHEGVQDHARELVLQFEGGRVARLLLDQGFGAWRCERSREFDFRADPAIQARQLRATDAGLSMVGGKTWFVYRVG